MSPIWIRVSSRCGPRGHTGLGLPHHAQPAMGRLDVEGNCVNARLTRDVSRITLSQSCLSSGWWFAECIMKNIRIMTNMTSAAYECKSWPQLRCQRP